MNTIDQDSSVRQEDKFPSRDSRVWQDSQEKVRSVTASTTVTADDDILLVNTTSGAVVITLPNAISRRKLIIVRVAGTNNVTLTPVTGNTINGAATLVISSSYHPVYIKAVSSQYIATDATLLNEADIGILVAAVAGSATQAFAMSTAAPGTNTTQGATTAFVTAADNLKANIASPTFTGVPAAPTATAGTNTTQLATTAFVTIADNLKANLAGSTSQDFAMNNGTAAGSFTVTGKVTSEQVGFRAYQNTAQSISATIFTKVTFDVENYDILGNFTADQFTAPVAGYYVFSAGCVFLGANLQRTILTLYLNGAEHTRVSDTITANADYNGPYGAAVMKLAVNDVVSVYVYSTVAETLLIGSTITFFSGHRIG